MPLPNGDDQVGGLCIHHELESAPFHHGSLHILLGSSICHRTRNGLSCIRMNHNQNCLCVQHIVRQRLFFLIFSIRQGDQQEKKEEGDRYAIGHSHLRCAP